MAASRALSFPLAILCLVLIRGHVSLPTTSAVPVLFEQPLNDDDYDPYAEPSTTQPPKRPGGPLRRCDYDECLDGQMPCSTQAATTGCLCPGYTPYNQLPNAPRMRSVSWDGSEVVVTWCAPASVITGFVVTVGGEEKQKFGENRRKGGVGTIDQISKVCVAAFNDAGESEPACLMYEPQDRTLLMAGLIGGALGFLLLLLLAVLLCIRRRQRKQQASISMHDTAGRQRAEGRSETGHAER